MQELLRSDADLHHKQQLLKRIPGIGEICSMYLLLSTKGFVKFPNARKYACYCAVVPFDQSSRTSMRGKSRVSPFADKKMKSLLHLASLTSIKHDPELKLYNERKQAEGKSKMLILYNILFKLIAQIFAVIYDESPFVKMHKLAA